MRTHPYNLDGSAKLLNDKIVNDAHSKTAATLSSFGRKERIKYLFFNFIRYAYAIVLITHYQIVTL